MEYMESKMQDQIDGGISENERLHAELSRLRDLVREMREALGAQEELSRTGILNAPYGALDKVAGLRREAIAKADAILKESGEPVSPIK